MNKTMLTNVLNTVFKSIELADTADIMVDSIKKDLYLKHPEVNWNIFTNTYFVTRRMKYKKGYFLIFNIDKYEFIIYGTSKVK